MNIQHICKGAKAIADRLLLATLLTLTVALPTAAQQSNRPAAPATPAQPSATTGENRIAIIDTGAFGDPKNGITRLTTAISKVQGEFQPQRAELQRLRQQYEGLTAEIEKTKDLANRQEFQKKVDQAEGLKREIERKAEDAQIAYNKRVQEVVGPLTNEISQAINAFVKRRGITLLLDASKLQDALLYASNSIEVTLEFIAEYNQQKPGTAANTKPSSSVAPTR